MNPYLFTGPGLVSLSGGRTSGYMLWKILEAHDGALPADVFVTFANTGKELEKTLRFVYEITSRWNVPVRWLELRGGERGDVVEVGYNSASRAGEPFDELIQSKQALPNWQARWCTGFLKVKAMLAFMEAQGFPVGSYVEMIGLRADEPTRIVDMLERNEREGRQCTAPLGRDGVYKPHIMAWWKTQDFDLGLRDGEGNCDLCFLKGQKLKKALITEDPAVAAQWIGWENSTGRTFDRRTSVEKLTREVRDRPQLFKRISTKEFDVECGLAPCPPAVVKPSLDARADAAQAPRRAAPA